MLHDPPKATRRARRSLNMQLDAELVGFLHEEAARTGVSMTELLEVLLRAAYLTQHQQEVTQHVLPDLSRLLAEELSRQLASLHTSLLDELEQEIKMQVRGMERRLGDRLAGLLIKDIRQSFTTHDIVSGYVGQQLGAAVIERMEHAALPRYREYITGKAPADDEH